MSFLAALTFPLAALAQELRLGIEFQVNSHTVRGQQRPSVAADADGDFVVAWDSLLQDDSFLGVFARRFSSAGAGLATEFQVNSYTLSEQYYPSVAVDADGDFVVAWTSTGGQDSVYDGPYYFGVFAQRFSSTGAALASEFLVNSSIDGAQFLPAVATAASGRFVVAWTSGFGPGNHEDGSNSGIFAQLFSSSGDPLAGEFQVNEYTPAYQFRPAVAADADGDFVVAWESGPGQDGDGSGIFAQRFSSSGARLATEFQVNLHVPGNQLDSSVAAGADGAFVIAWESASGQDGDGSGIFAQRFSSSGARLATEFQVNLHVTGSQRYASASAAADGDFVIAWSSAPGGAQDGSQAGTFARRFSSAGDPQASEFQVNTYTTDSQQQPSVAMKDGGAFVVAWQSYGQDGYQASVFAQRFAVPSALDVDGDGFAEPLTDGLLILRYLFGFRAGTLTSGAVDLLNCLRCTAPPIETYLAGMVVTAPLADAIRLGNEFQVNSHTADGQTSPSMAAETNGDFVLAWQSDGQDGDAAGVFTRRFSSTGTALASELQVNTYAAADQARPSAAIDADGDFVVAWQSDGQDGDTGGIVARRFSSVGAAVASEFQVNSYTMSNQSLPSVAVDTDGDFLIAWESYQDGSGPGIFARRFSSIGVALASEFQVNSHTTSEQSNPTVAAHANGAFLLAWQSFNQDGVVFGVFARSFTSAGTALASEFQVNTYVTSNQVNPSVAATAGGEFVITWNSGQDGWADGVFARRFSSVGAALTSEFQVNTYTTDIQTRPSIDAAVDGDFVIAWAGSQDGSPMGIFARRFSSVGTPLADEFEVNAYTEGSQAYPAVAVDAHDRFVVAWQDSARDGSSDGVFAQRFLGSLPPLDIDGNGAAEPLTDGLLALRYLFGFRGATLIQSVVGGGCTRCNAPAIEAYLAQLVS